MKKNHHDNASKKKVREPGWLYARAYSSDAELRLERAAMRDATRVRCNQSDSLTGLARCKLTTNQLRLHPSSLDKRSWLSRIVNHSRPCKHTYIDPTFMSTSKRLNQKVKRIAEKPHSYECDSMFLNPDG